MEVKRNQRKQRIGVVVTDSMNKTIKVQVETKIKHPLYKKFIKRKKKLLCTR